MMMHLISRKPPCKPNTLCPLTTAESRSNIWTENISRPPPFPFTANAVRPKATNPLLLVRSIGCVSLASPGVSGLPSLIGAALD